MKVFLTGSDSTSLHPFHSSLISSILMVLENDCANGVIPVLNSAPVRKYELEVGDPVPEEKRGQRV